MWRHKRGFLSQWSVQGQWFENEVTWVDHEQSLSHLAVFAICVSQHVFLMMGPDTSPGAARSAESHKVERLQEKQFHTDCKIHSGPLNCLKRIIWEFWKMVFWSKFVLHNYITLNQIFSSHFSLKLADVLPECAVCAQSLWPLHILYVWNLVFPQAACLGKMDLLLGINRKGFRTLWKVEVT